MCSKHACRWWSAMHGLSAACLFGGYVPWFTVAAVKLGACRASLEALEVMGTCPDILHLHEWQCAAVSMLYWDVYYNTGFNSARVVLTIHNMDNSGECRQDEFAVTGVPGVHPPPLLPSRSLCSLDVAAIFRI